MALHPQPVALVAAPITIPANTGPGKVFSPTTTLRNTDSVGVSIDKIVFAPTNPTVEFAVRLAYQGETITNGWIPAHAFCWPLNDAGYQRVGPSVVFSRPIYLAPGEWIDLSIQTMTTDPTLNVIAVSALGREVSAPPLARTLPYLASFLGAPRDFTSGLAFDETSSPQDLGNPFNVELQVERIVGTIYSGAVLTVGAPSPDWSIFNLTITDQADRFWIPRPSPFPAVFDMPARSWVVKAPMPPRGFLRARIEGTAPITIVATYQPVLGIVSYRKIAG